MGARNSSITGNSDNNTVYGNITQERDLSKEGIQHSPLQTQSNDPMMTNASPSVTSTPSGILTSRIKDTSNVPTLNHSMEVSTMSPPTTASYTDWLYSTAAANPYFHAGAGLYSLTVAAVICRYGFQMVLSALKRRYVVSMEMTNRDVSHDWMMQWMARNPSFSFQQVSVITKDVTIHANEESTSNCSFAPCPNVPHWFMHNGWPIVVYRKRQVERAAGSDVLEMLELYTLGRSKTIMEEIVKEAKKQAIDRDSDKTIIYQNAGGRWIRNQGERARRPMNSVVLAGNSRDALVEDVKLFLQSHSYYQNLGVPYRRGYLLHGPPGCGKSSFVMALAGELRLAICLLSLSNRALDDESLNSLLNSAPLCSIVLMEDIDRAFCNESRVTMSGVLNALDGVAAQEGRLVFMTTNHVERLDAALIRPGRADIKMEIGLLRRKQAKDIFSKFFPKCSEETQERFAATLPDGVVSVAQIQSHLFLHRNSAEDAVNALPDFLNAIMEFDEKIEKAREMDRRIREVKNPKFVHEMGL
eukprot:Tbor_TRINITY_DN2359_c0_g1::TRINITY_DN2359_c0_g1_i1::g.112::m.112/K08900/BCS1; mitochondrial chaperone BCS1